MKKYLSILILFGLLLVPVISRAQVSSTVSHQVIPVLKKSYTQAVKDSSVAKTATPRSVLKVGMKGEDVRYLQAWLFNQGYNVDIDGSFGNQTKQALMAFQKQTKVLKADGVFGPGTALYVANAPTGVALKSLDEGVVQYLKQQQLTILSGKTNTKVNSASTVSITKNPVTKTSTSKIILAKLPKDVSSVLAKALPQAPKFTAVQVASKTTTPTKSVTKKPKAAIAALLAKAKVTLVTAGGVNNVAVAGTNTNFDQAKGEATLYNICAEYQGDNTCVAVSMNIAEAIKAGQLDAADVIAQILGSDDGGSCPFCSKDDNGNITITSGGGCGGGGGPGSGEFITPPGTPVGVDPDACIPASAILGKSYNLDVTSDNVFHAYWGVEGSNGNESLVSIGADMNWDETTPNSNGTQPGWKSSEHYSGTAPANAKNVYFAAFHDGWVTHGFLASLKAGEETYTTGTPVFEVTKTTVPGPVHPADFAITDVLNQIKSAAWAQTFAIGENGVSPWGKIAGIAESAKWIFEGNDWDPEGKMANYEIYRLKICDGEGGGDTTVGGICMNYRTDENGDPTDGKAYYKVTFSDAVTVTGVPQLWIQKSPSAPTVKATFLEYADTDHKSIKFVAEIDAGLNLGIDDANYDGVGTIHHINGSAIKNAAGQNAPTSVGTFSKSNACTAPNTPAPEMCTGWADVAVYGDDVIEYKVTYPASVTVDNKGNNSNIELIIDHTNPSIPNTTAVLVGVSGNTLHFVRNSTNLQVGYALLEYTGQATLNFKNGATLKIGGVSANKTLGSFNSECIQILSGTADYRAPLLPGEPSGNKRADYMITFNRPVVITGAPTLKVKSASGTEKVEATYLSGSGTTTLVFHASYPVTGAGVPSFPTDYEGTGVFYLNGGTIKDMNDHPMNLTVPASVIFDY